MTESDNRQRLRREAVERAMKRRKWHEEDYGSVIAGGKPGPSWLTETLAMESLLVEAETEIQSIWAKAHLLIDAETDRAEKAEARVRALEAFVYRCAEGDHPDEIPEEAQEMLAAEQEEGT